MRWWLPLGLVGCIENGFNGGNADSVGVTYGDFDDLTPSLDRQAINHAIYEGLISNATWSDDDVSGVPVEGLLLDNDAKRHTHLLIASGTRGLGNTVYNRNERDDALLADGTGIENARRFVASGRSVLVTDWAYDLTEQAWPDAVEFHGDDGIFDAAQVGDIGTVIAKVTEPSLAEALGMEQVVLEYNYSNWAVITDVGPDTTVWLRGDVRAWNGEAYEDVLDVPLLVSYEPEGERKGRVVVMTFHGNAQPAALTDTLLSTLIGPLPLVRE